MPRDPVCTAHLKEENIKSTATFKGEMYYFCCPSCQEKFLHNPQKYVSATNTKWWKRFLQRLEKASEEEYGNSKPSCH